MKSPVQVLIEYRQEVFLEYERVLNIESHLSRESKAFSEFEKDKHYDLLMIKRVLDEYDLCIYYLSEVLILQDN